MQKRDSLTPQIERDDKNYIKGSESDKWRQNDVEKEVDRNVDF